MVPNRSTLHSRSYPEESAVPLDRAEKPLHIVPPQALGSAQAPLDITKGSTSHRDEEQSRIISGATGKLRCSAERRDGCFSGN